MNVVDYCKGMEMELTAWKAKMYDLTRKVESLGSKEREKVLPNIQDLNMLIVDMSSRIDQLKNECPTEWTPQKKDIDGGTVDIDAGGSLFVDAPIEVNSGGEATGGEISMRGGVDVFVRATVDAQGGDYDGGTIELSAGRDLLATASVSADANRRSRFGGRRSSIDFIMKAITVSS